MNLAEWKAKAGDNFRTFARTVNQGAPEMIYGSLAACSLLPLVAAAQQGQVPYIELFGLFGNIGGNLIANQLQKWQDLSQEQLGQELENRAAQEAELQVALNTLLREFEAPRVVQAILSEAERDWFVATLRQELATLAGGMTVDNQGTLIVAGNDAIQTTVGDDADMVASGKQITQSKTIYYQTFSGTDSTTDLRTRYLSYIVRTCNSLPLADLGGDDVDGARTTLDDLYITLNTTTQEPLTEAEIAAKKAEGQRIGDNEQRQLTALEIATREPYLVLLGDPGSGKSTFGRKMAGWLANAALGHRAPPDGWPSDLLPVFTILRDFARRIQVDELTKLHDRAQKKALVELLLDHWRAELVTCHIGDFGDPLVEALTAGQVYLVFDGLDEVPQKSRTLVRKAVQALLAEYHAISRVLITCRVRSYGDAVRFPWPDHRLAPFDREQIERFVDYWYRARNHLSQDQSEAARLRRTQDLQQAVLSRELSELSPNPMLLTTMAIIHEKEKTLPKQRVELYKLAVDNLLLRWQQSKLAVSPALERLLNDSHRLPAIMELIAYNSLVVRNRSNPKENGKSRRRSNQSEESSSDLRRGELLDLLLDFPEWPADVNPTEFLDYIDQRAGLLIGHGGAEDESQDRPDTRTTVNKVIYRFPHRTFQEYLAGRYLVSQPNAAHEYWQLAEEEGWDLAALLGGEELYFTNTGGNRHLLYDILFTLCPATQQPSKNGNVDWRRVLWSAQLATLFGRTSIEHYARGPQSGKAYLKHLIKHLLRGISIKSDLPPIDRAIAGVAFGKLGDPRSGVGVNDNIPDIAWSELIAPGPFTMGSDKEKDELAYRAEFPQFTCNLITEPYQISRYPITIAQYQCFINAGGYADAQWWTAAGWQWRQEQTITGPETYREVFQTPNHPQVGISWFEAVAFCRWFTNIVGYTVNLPSEAQWERAARHTDARIYPWGDEFDKSRCNSGYSDIGNTSAVGIFPTGNAPCGAADLSGNVWEWCSTEWLDNYEEYERKVNDDPEGTGGRVLRGGAYLNFVDFLRGACRYDHRPNFRLNDLGFRVVRPGSVALISAHSDL